MGSGKSMHQTAMRCIVYSMNPGTLKRPKVYNHPDEGF